MSNTKTATEAPAFGLDERVIRIAGSMYTDIIVETFSSEHHVKRVERDTRNQGWGSTEEGKALAKRYLVKATDAVAAALGTLDTSKIPADFLRLDPALMALIALQGILDTSVIKPTDNRPTRANTQFAIGDLAQMEAYALLAREVNPQAFKDAAKAAHESRCQVSSRRSEIDAPKSRRHSPRCGSSGSPGPRRRSNTWQTS